MPKYQIFYKENRNIILSEDEEPQIFESEIYFRGSENILVLKKGAILNNASINFFGKHSLVFIGEGKFSADVSIFTNSIAYFGKNIYFNPKKKAQIKVAEHQNIYIGKDSLISSEVSIETNDAHLIYEVDGTKLKRINKSKDIVVENKVWIGKNVALGKGAYISYGTVVGTKSLVTKPFEKSNCILAGVPAKIIKENIFWRGNNTNNYDLEDTIEWLEYAPKDSDVEYFSFKSYLDSYKEQAILFKSKHEKLVYKLTFLERLYTQTENNVHQTDSDFIENLSWLRFFSSEFKNREFNFELPKHFEGKNIHEIAIKKLDENISLLYKHLLANDYIFYCHESNISKMIKRSEYCPKELDEKNPEAVRRFENLFYYIEYLGDKKTSSKEKRLLVIFSSMPATEKENNPSMIFRSGFPTFSNIKRSLPKDTYIVRVVDFNLASGSFYTNTANYPTFESEVQKLIRVFADSHDVPDENIVLFGPSKGGTGALIHSLIGGYKAVAVDPIIDDSIYQYDQHFQKSFRDWDLVPRVNQLLSDSENKKRYIVNNRHVGYTYKQYARLNTKNLKFYDTRDKVANQHHQILHSAIPEVLAILTILLNSNLDI